MRANTFPRMMAAMVLAGGLALAGCSGDAEKKAEEELGPLDKYFQVLYGNEEWDEDKAKQQDAEMQELIAQCMTDLGWEYTPIPWQDGSYRVYDSEEDDGPAWGTREFAERYGYGMVEWPGMEEQEQEPSEEATEWVDPNQDYVMSLSESEQQAFYEALYGNWDGMGEELDEDGNPIEQDIDWSQMGCQGKAQSQVQGDQAYQDPEFAELFELMNETYVTWETNDELAALESEWSACMATKGFTLANRDEAWTRISEIANEQMWPEDVDWETYQGPSQEVKDAVQAQEIEQAVADFDCAEEVDYTKRQRDVQWAVQQKFVDEHRAELDALVAKFGQDKKEEDE